MGDRVRQIRVQNGWRINDTAQAATSQLLLGPPGSEIATRGFDQHDRGDPMRLWNLAPITPPGKDYSRINQGSKELIDHILAFQASYNH